MYAKYKAEVAYATGGVIVKEERLSEVLEELKKYSGTYYSDISMNGLVAIEKAEV